MASVPQPRMMVTGRIRTMAGPDERADWMLVDSGRIVATGSGLAPEHGDGVDRLSLGDSTVLPALADCHVHFLETGLLDVDVDLSVSSCFDEVLALIADGARDVEGSMLRAHSFDPDLLSDGRYPTIRELDAISTELPIIIRRRDGHSSVLNTRAMEALRIGNGIDGVEVDTEGCPTGVMRMDANTLAARRSRDALSREEQVRSFHEAARKAASRGIGVVHTLVGSCDPDNRDLEVLLETARDLPIEIVPFAQMEDIDRVVSLGLPRIGGCLLLDGSFSSGTAALMEPYADRPGNGVLYYDDDHLTGFFRRAHERGLQVSVHALGERAIGQALRCYRDACGGECRDSRHRIEHCELPSRADIAEMRSLGVAACVQPTFELLWGDPGGMIEKRLGTARAARTNPYRTYLDAGVRLAGGSDSYVTPMDSLLGIHAAVNRPNAAERICVYDAVSLFTRGAAWISFDDGRRGTLEAGKEASFCVLDADPFEVAPGRIRDIRSERLFRAGVEITPQG